MNIHIYYTFYFISIIAIVIGIWFLITTEKQYEELAIPVVLAYSESQQSRSSAVHIGDGYFLTAAHILGREQKEVVLETNLRQKLVADVLWSSVDYDISLLHTKHYESVDIESFPIECSSLEIGDELRFIGNPSNATFISTWGRVSSFEKSVGIWNRIIPVDGTILPGMSGGAAVDEDNRLRGINVGTLRAVVGMTPMGPDASFTGISYIVEAADICFLMGKT